MGCPSTRWPRRRAKEVIYVKLSYKRRRWLEATSVQSRLSSVSNLTHIQLTQPPNDSNNYLETQDSLDVNSSDRVKPDLHFCVGSTKSPAPSPMHPASTAVRIYTCKLVCLCYRRVNLPRLSVQELHPR